MRALKLGVGALLVAGTHCGLPAGAGAHASAGSVAPAVAADPGAFDAARRRLLTQGDAWQDETGATVTLSSYGSGTVVLTMLYTECRRTCPLVTVDALHELARVLDARHEPAQYVVATLDPESDTPEVLARFKASRGFSRPDFHFVRSSPAETRRFATALGLGGYYRVDDHIAHDFGIVVLDAAANRARRLDWDHRDAAALLGS